MESPIWVLFKWDSSESIVMGIGEAFEESLFQCYVILSVYLSIFEMWTLFFSLSSSIRDQMCDSHKRYKIYAKFAQNKNTFKALRFDLLKDKMGKIIAMKKFHLISYSTKRSKHVGWGEKKVKAIAEVVVMIIVMMPPAAIYWEILKLNWIICEIIEIESEGRRERDGEKERAKMGFGEGVHAKQRRAIRQFDAHWKKRTHTPSPKCK